MSADDTQPVNLYASPRSPEVAGPVVVIETWYLVTVLTYLAVLVALGVTQFWLGGFFRAFNFELSRHSLFAVSWLPTLILLMMLTFLGAKETLLPSTAWRRRINLAAIFGLIPFGLWIAAGFALPFTDMFLTLE